MLDVYNILYNITGLIYTFYNFHITHHSIDTNLIQTLYNPLRGVYTCNIHVWEWILMLCVYIIHRILKCIFTPTTYSAPAPYTPHGVHICPTGVHICPMGCTYDPRDLPYPIDLITFTTVFKIHILCVL